MSTAARHHASSYSATIWRSYAKINLYLDVLRKRRDGYHNIETIFQTVGLYDELSFMNDRHVSMTCSGADLDTGASNLVFRAATLLKEATGYSGGARIHLEKRIPIAAGLAGGSGNAAATLTALNKLWELRLPMARLMRYARVLGADVPYCMRGGTVAAWLRGEAMRPLPPLSGLWIVLAYPPIAVSAGHVYGHPMLEHSRARPFAGHSASLRRAIAAAERRDFSAAVFNRMERPVFHEFPSLAGIKETLLSSGCQAAAMSGSGPTLFGICPSRRQAEHIAEALGANHPECRVSVCADAPCGVERMK